MSKNEKIAVVGLGYVGLPLALLAKEKGYDVIGIDLSKEKVDLINKQVSPIEEKGLHKWLKKAPFNASTNTNDAADADIILICVPTPVKNRTEPDLGPVKGAVEAVSKVMKKGALLVVESTINPGVCDETVLPLVKLVTGFEEDEFDLAHCPERINPGDPNFSVRNINRVVGGHTEKARDRAVKFYKSIVNAEIKPMNSLKEAEAVKVVENSFRDVNIAFVNELAMSFHKLGIDVENVIDGAATKPFAFMAHRPGAGVGGHCIPVDPYYLIDYAKSYDFHHDFLTLARRINSGMPEFTIQLLQDAMNQAGLPMKGSTVAILGLSYKPNVDDDRESPSYEIQRLLEGTGAKVITHDPYILRNSTHDDLEKALTEADGVIVATGHEVFAKITPKKYAEHKVKAVADGRNLYKADKNKFKEHKVQYVGIGVRADA